MPTSIMEQEYANNLINQHASIKYAIIDVKNTINTINSIKMLTPNFIDRFSFTNYFENVLQILESKLCTT